MPITYRQQMLDELECMPDEYLPFMLQVMRSFRETLDIKPAEECFRQGWREAQAGQTLPIEKLWEGIDAK